MKIKGYKTWVNPLHIIYVKELTTRDAGGNDIETNIIIKCTDGVTATVSPDKMSLDEVIDAVEMELAEIIPLYRKIESTGPK